MRTFEGQHVVVTGSTGNLGAAIVDALRERGATCHLPARPEVDLGTEADVEAFFAKIERLDASIHVVGAFDMRPVEATSLEQFRRQIDLNLVTTFLCCREATKRMRAGGRGGRIVNVGSRNAVVPSSGTLAYSTAKAAVAALTQNLALEVAGDAILVNAVLPGTLDTQQNRAAMPKADFDRWVKTSDVAEAVLFLAGPANTATSGALVPVYGRS